MTLTWDYIRWRFAASKALVSVPSQFHMVVGPKSQGLYSLRFHYCPNRRVPLSSSYSFTVSFVCLRMSANVCTCSGKCNLSRWRSLRRIQGATCLQRRCLSLGSTSAWLESSSLLPCSGSTSSWSTGAFIIWSTFSLPRDTVKLSLSLWKQEFLDFWFHDLQSSQPVCFSNTFKNLILIWFAILKVLRHRTIGEATRISNVKSEKGLVPQEKQWSRLHPLCNNAQSVKLPVKDRRSSER